MFKPPYSVALTSHFHQLSSIVIFLIFSNAFCECPKGRSRGPCPHKAAIEKYFNVAELSALPFNDSNARALWHYIGSGTVLDDAWYRELNKPNDISTNNISEYINSHREQVNTEYIPDEITNFHSNDHDESDMISDDHDDVDISDDHEEELRQQAIRDYHETHVKFSAYMIENLNDPGMLKAFKKFTKFMEKETKRKNKETLKRKLFDLCHESKKKIGNNIPVQNTSISRRQYKSRGRVISGYGRKAKNSRLRSQMLVTDNDESTYPALNTPQKRSNRRLHDLSTAVAQNVNNSKKH